MTLPTPSESSSPDTGATTHCSVFGSSSILSLPSIYVYLVSASLTTSTLEETFKKHASDNRLGVIIDQNSLDSVNQSFSCKGEWTPLSLPSHGNGGSIINYFVSTIVDLEDHVLPVGLIYHIAVCLLISVWSTGHSLHIHESFTSKSRKYFLSLWSSLHIFSPLDNIFDPAHFRKTILCLPTSLVQY